MIVRRCGRIRRGSNVDIHIHMIWRNVEIVRRCHGCASDWRRMYTLATHTAGKPYHMNRVKLRGRLSDEASGTED